MNHSTVAQVSEKLRLQLEDKLRQTNYGDLVALSNWLRSKGSVISRAALGRYAIALRSADISAGRPMSALLVERAAKVAARRSKVTVRRPQVARFSARLAKIQAAQEQLFKDMLQHVNDGHE